MTTVEEPRDIFDAGRALGAAPPLRAFNEAGILTPADVHVAERLAALAGETDGAVRLAAALAARAPRLGHVCVDLRTVGETASADTDVAADLAALPWPDPGTWPAVMAASALVGVDGPFRLEGPALYLDRLWEDERTVADELGARAAAPADDVDPGSLATGLARLFSAEGADLQRMAAATAVLRRLSVVAGGPGTGKTTTVARVLALLDAQAVAAGRRPPLVALTAPTGKAAARLEEAVRSGAADLPLPTDTRDRLGALRATTLHRLLGFNPGNRTRFRHNRLNRLAHDVVVVDETSMVSLTLMARLVEAVRPLARLVLIGDPEQLASVEAGAVLGDIVGPASAGPRMGAAARDALRAVCGEPVPDGATVGPAIGDSIVVLRRGYRFGGAIADLAEAVQRGDADGALEVLARGDADVQWIATDATAPDAASALTDVRALAVQCGRTVRDAAEAGDARAAITALGAFRLLCAHRRGPAGVAAWTQHVEGWLRAEVEGFSAGSDWYVGRPLIVTENDYGLQLYNGDTGVAVATPSGRLVAAFERGGDIAEVSPARLGAVDSVYAMTVHKSQGSQFEEVAFVLPGAESRVLTRELLYTAVTRAEKRLILVGPEAPIRAAVDRPISRASGLRRALWGDEASGAALPGR